MFNLATIYVSPTQVGLTTKQQYIHRLGRTARAGRRGEGVLMVSPFEAGFLRNLQDLPITDWSTRYPSVLSPVSPRLLQAIAGVCHEDELYKSAGQAYQAW